MFKKNAGFSLVELMVALLFTGLLMAGMARVYQASLSSFVTSAEKLSASRRGRIAVDMISDDLNAAGMYLWDISQYPSALAPTNPGFWVNPNTVVNYSEGNVASDEIYFYYDEPLPFEGVLSPGAGGVVFGLRDFEANGAAVTDAALKITVDTGSPSFAYLVKAGQRLIIKDGWPGFKISSVTQTGALVEITPAMDYQDQAGSPTGGNWISKDRHKAGSPVTFMNVAQMVRYSVQARKLDPADPDRDILCLVREQGTYDPGGAGLAGITSSQVLAEDVSALEVYLSVDGGRTWLRETAATGFTAGWDQGYRPKVENQLKAGYGRKKFQNLDNPNWFRDIPVLVRVDVKTRTAVKRTEYATASSPTDYKEGVQSLVIRPRHFGLTFN